MSQNQLQQLSQELQAIEAEIEELRETIEGLEDEKNQIDEAVEAIETLDSGSTVQVPLGGGAYVRAEVQDIDEIIVNLGADFAAEMEGDGAVETLRHKQEAIDDRIDDRREEISTLESESEEIEQQAQQLQQQMQQQQLQQLQGMDEEGDE